MNADTIINAMEGMSFETPKGTMRNPRRRPSGTAVHVRDQAGEKGRLRLSGTGAYA